MTKPRRTGKLYESVADLGLGPNEGRSPVREWPNAIEVRDDDPADMDWVLEICREFVRDYDGSPKTYLLARQLAEALEPKQ